MLAYQVMSKRRIPFLQSEVQQARAEQPSYMDLRTPLREGEANDPPREVRARVDDPILEEDLPRMQEEVLDIDVPILSIPPASEPLVAEQQREELTPLQQHLQDLGLTDDPGSRLARRR